MSKFSLIPRNLLVFLPFAVPAVVYASEKPKIDDCNDPVCDDTKDNLFKSFKRRHSKVLLNKRIACPLSKSQYGKSTWEFLHTIAAYYPDEPTKTDRKSATNLIDSVKQLYACKLEEIRIERHLLFQEYYKSFRYRSLENNKLNIIESLEEATYDNFCDAKDFLKETNVDSPKTRLIKTKEKDNSYTNQNEIKFGSCIYLTRDIETQELIISWEDEL